jgi:dihydrofolate reductase
MGKLIMWNMVTLDGFFEGTKSWDIDFHNLVWGDELEQFSIDQLKLADSLVFGRVTYEGMASYWMSGTGTIADFMNSIPKQVFSRTLKSAEWNNSRVVPDAREMGRIKSQAGGNIMVFGSGNLSAALADQNLFDEYRLCVVPVVLGEGNPLFKPSSQQRPMKLLSSRTLRTGAVILHYEPLHDGARPKEKAS